MPTRVRNLTDFELSLPFPFSKIIPAQATEDFDDVFYSTVVTDDTVADMLADGTISLVDLAPLPLNSFDKSITGVPTVGAAEGYSVGSLVVESGGAAYICTDASVPTWVQITP